MPIDAFLNGTNIALVFLAVVIGVLVVKGIKMVPQGEEWTVERFGRYVRTLPPGLGLINPLFSRIGRKINMMETLLDIPEQDVITRDNASVKVDAIVFYQVVDARRAAYEVRDLDRALVNLALDQHPLGARQHRPGRGAVVARRHEPQDPSHHGRGDRPVGHQDHPGRDPGHLAAPGPARRHGRADEGRAREARPDPRCPGLSAVADRTRRRRQAVEDPAGRRRPGGGQARGRGPRTPGAGRGERDGIGGAGDQQGRSRGGELLRRPEVHRGAGRVRAVAQPEDCVPAARGDQPAGIDRRHQGVAARSSVRPRTAAASRRPTADRGAGGAAAARRAVPPSPPAPVRRPWEGEGEPPEEDRRK